MRRLALLLSLALVGGCPGAGPPPGAPVHETIRPVDDTPRVAADVPTSTIAASPELALVDAPADPPVTALSAALPTHDAQLRMLDTVTDVHYPMVDLADARAKEELDARLRSALFGKTRTGDGATHGRCVATLATAELVSVMCDVVTTGGREQSPGPMAGAVTLRLGANGPKRVAVELAFAEGTQLGRAVCAKALGHAPGENDDCSNVEISLAADHLVGRVGGFDDRRGRLTVKRVDVPYSELAPLIRRDGFLAFAAGEAPAGAPPLALQMATALERRGIGYGEAGSPAEIGSALLRSHVAYVTAFAVPAGHGRFRIGTQNGFPADDAAAVVRAAGASSPLTWSPSVATLLSMESRSGVALYDAPGGALRQQLGPGTRVIGFDGVVEGRDSMWSPLDGVWIYVVATQTAAGWARASTVAYESGASGDPDAADSAFAAAVPEDARAAVARDTVMTMAYVEHTRAEDRRQIRLGRTPAASWVGVYEGGTAMLFARVDGRAGGVRAFVPQSGADSLVVVSSRVAADAPGVERWSVFALGHDTPLASFSASTGADAPDAERATVLVAGADATRDALEVRGGATPRHFAWDGATLAENATH